MTSDLTGQLEPSANMPGASSTECSLISIAISLKRIADVAEQVVSYQYNEPAIRIRS